MRKVPNLSISPEKVFFLIAKSRQSDGNANRSDPAADPDDDMPEDRHDQSERAFLKALAGRLNVAVTTGETSALTIVASPRALGMIRPDYSDAVRKAVHGEIAKDLVKMPIHEIEKQLLS